MQIYLVVCFLLEIVQLGETVGYLPTPFIDFCLLPATPCSRFPLDIVPYPVLILSVLCI